MIAAGDPLLPYDDRRAPEDSTFERVLKRQIAAHNLEAVVVLYDLTEAQVSAMVRRRVSDEITVRRIVSRVYASLWEEISTYDDAHYTLTGWLMHRAEILVRDQRHAPPATPMRP